MRAAPVRSPEHVRPLEPEEEIAPSPPPLEEAPPSEEAPAAAGPEQEPATIDRSRALERAHDPNTARLRQQLDDQIDGVSREPETRSSSARRYRVEGAVDQTAPEMLWNDAGVDLLRATGSEQGGLSEERAERNREISETALREQSEPLSFEGADVAQILDAAGGSASRHSEGQLESAANYVSRATSAEDQQRRLTSALDNLSIAETIGAPELTDGEFTQAMWDGARIPGHAIDGFSQERRDQIFRDVARATNTPGEHQIKIDNYRVNLATGEDGLEASSTKRHSPWATVGKIALNVGLGVAAAFTGGAALVAVRLASSAIGIVDGIRNRSVLGAIAGAAGAFGAVAGQLGASSWAQGASMVGRGARAVDGGINSVRGGSWAGVIGAVADGAGIHSDLDGLEMIAGRASMAASVVEGIRDGEGLRALGSGVNLVGGWEQSGRLSAAGRTLAATQNGALQAASAGLGLFTDPNGGGSLDRIGRLVASASDVDLAWRSGDAGLLAEASVGFGSTARSSWPVRTRSEPWPHAAQEVSDIDLTQLGTRIDLDRVLALPEMESRLLESRPIDITAIELMPSLQSGHHLVREGDTLESIAERYRFTPDEIRQENGLGRSVLEPGDVLQIPSSDRLRVQIDQYGNSAVKLLTREQAAREHEEKVRLLGQLQSTGGYDRLDPISRAHATRALTRAGAPDAELAADLRSLVGSSRYGSLSPELRFELLDSATQLPLSSDRRTMLSLQSTPGFGALPESERLQLARLAGGTNLEVSTPARIELANVLASSTFTSDDARGQAAQLSAFLENQPSLPSHAGVAGFDFPSANAQHRLSERRAPAPSTRSFVLDVEGRSIPIVVPTTSSTAPSAGDIAQAIASLPASERRLIDRVTVSSTADPDGAYMRAGAEGEITIYPTATRQSTRFLRESFVHETGHVQSRRLWGAPENAAWDEWKRAMTRDRLEASDYARTSSFRFDDDFAEHRLLYLKVRGTRDERELRKLFPARWAILDRITR